MQEAHLLDIQGKLTTTMISLRPPLDQFLLRQALAAIVEAHNTNLVVLVEMITTAEAMADQTRHSHEAIENQQITTTLRGPSRKEILVEEADMEQVEADTEEAEVMLDLIHEALVITVMTQEGVDMEMETITADMVVIVIAQVALLAVVALVDEVDSVEVTEVASEEIEEEAAVVDQDAVILMLGQYHR